jgi:hypothetical protein
MKTPCVPLLGRGGGEANQKEPTQSHENAYALGIPKWQLKYRRHSCKVDQMFSLQRSGCEIC